MLTFVPLRASLENLPSPRLAHPRYLIEPFTIIDLLAILPGIIKFSAICGAAVPPALMGGALINLRLLRILRFQRILKDYDTFKKFESALGIQASDIRPYQLPLASGECCRHVQYSSWCCVTF